VNKINNRYAGSLDINFLLRLVYDINIILDSLEQLALKIKIFIILPRYIFTGFSKLKHIVYCTLKSWVVIKINLKQ